LSRHLKRSSGPPVLQGSFDEVNIPSRKHCWSPIIFALWLGCLPTTAAAQSEDGEVWISTAVSGPIAKDVQLSFDTSVRLSDSGTREPTRVIRPMLGYQASKRLSLWVGYTRVEQFPNARAPAIENRMFEQLSWNIGRIGVASISVRSRLEQRFFENGVGKALRARQLIKIAVAVKGTKASIIATSEPFITLQSDVFGATHGLEQWRNSISILAPVTRNISVEIGYLNRYIRHNGDPDGVDHIIPLTLAYHF